MATDTEEKRRAALAAGKTGITLPTADGSIDAFDRGHLVGAYIGANAPVPGGNNSSRITVYIDERRRRRK